MSAWTGEVPFFVTSNTFIADAYAQVIIGYIRDQIQLSPNKPDQPFYVLELGSGPGRFAFYCAKRLLELNMVALPRY
ncbi:MAG: class I SAM-dependent methyltransferase [Gammaproteobacteria bacterium]|nr:class I SAM-dependent methyltransferase [Gammaproteobacteria bacterium]